LEANKRLQSQLICFQICKVYLTIFDEAGVVDDCPPHKPNIHHDYNEITVYAEHFVVLVHEGQASITKSEEHEIR